MATASLIKHPLDTLLEPTWRAALDVHEGLGGFLDPDRPYLVPHPREWLDHSIRREPTADNPASVIPNPDPKLPSPKLVMRRKLARYENIAEAIVSQVTGALFLMPADRTFTRKNPKVAAWLENTDGTGTAITDLMREMWIGSAVFGHVIHVVDKGTTEPATAADVSVPIVRRYTPLDLIDWLVDDRGNVTAVKLMEAAPRTSLEQVHDQNDYRIRTVTNTTWKLVDRSGKVISEGEHGFGRLPVVFQYAKRRTLTPVVGKSVMGDPALYIDLYNLTSELRELLRNQTFAILNVPIGTGADASLEREQQLIGSQVGTGGVMFSTQPAQDVSPDGTNAEIYHEHLDRLARMIYRLASAPWEGDSRDAEAADSRRIKRLDQTQVLAGYAGRIQSAEVSLLELIYRGLYGDRWEQEWQKDQPSVAYPREFEPPDVQALAMDAAEVIGLDLGPTATKEIKKRLARKTLPDLEPETQQVIDTEIDTQKIVSAEERRRQMLQLAAQRFDRDASGEDEDEPPQDKEPDDATGAVA